MIYIKGVELPELSDYSKANNTSEIYNLHGAIVVYPDGKAELRSYVGIFEGTYDIISVPHGKWRLNSDGSGTCSVCHFTQSAVWDDDGWQNFCGHCGADMRLEPPKEE